jgi:UDP-N-acetylmuramyl-tripeptide synthetase
MSILFDYLQEYTEEIADLLWGWPLIIFIIFVGVISTFATRFVQFRLFHTMIMTFLKPGHDTKQSAEQLTPFQAFYNSLNGSVGNGILAGMATALFSGGPGILVWILIIGFFAMAIRFVEVYASTTYATYLSPKLRYAGPFAYIQQLPWGKPLAYLYTFFCLALALIAGCGMQCNSITHSFTTTFSAPAWIMATILTLLTMYIMFGGAPRIIKISERIAPVKLLLFTGATAALLLKFHTNIIPSITMAFNAAFDPSSMFGGLLGYTVYEALRYGSSRTINATETGLGVAGVSFGACEGINKERASLMGMGATLLSTIICFLFTLSLLVSNVWQSPLNGIALTSAAYRTVFHHYGPLVTLFLSSAFGIGVLVAYAYIGKTCWDILTRHRLSSVYTFLFCSMAAWGSLTTITLVWTMTDVINAGLVIINLLGLMYILKPLFRRIKITPPATLPTLYPITSHTKHVGPDSTFVAIKGLKEDGLSYIHQAIINGATTIVIDQHVAIPEDLQEKIISHKIQVITTAHTRKEFSLLSAKIYGYPEKHLKIIGITGTKGKSTTAFLLNHMLATAGLRTALLTTVHNKILDQVYPTELTTQQPDYLQMFLKTCVENKIDYVVLEIAAQALTCHRIDGIKLSGIIFTNFSQEHAEFYPTQQDYFKAKASIVSHAHEHVPFVVSSDDPKILAIDTGHTNPYFVSACELQNITSSFDGLSLIYHKTHLFCPALMGDYNAANIQQAATMALKLGISLKTIQQACATFTGVPGRLEKVALHHNSIAVIDYAHTPSSFQAVLSTLRPLTNNLVVVFGCGGDRDPIKRPIMGTIAASIADHIFVTSDNPRSEQVEDIITQIMVGITPPQISKVIIEPDRKKAIELAYKLIKPGSIIALLGKGPDEYELVNGIKTHFSEKEILHNLDTSK